MGGRLVEAESKGSPCRLETGQAVKRWKERVVLKIILRKCTHPDTDDSAGTCDTAAIEQRLGVRR